MNNPLVSLIVPVYNSEKYIDECVNSLLNQTYKNIEIIIINDGSTDNSIHKINNFLSDKRVKIIDQKNSGVSVARNRALENAKGFYIVFVDSDDYLPSDAVEILVSIIIRDRTDIVNYSIKYIENNTKRQNNLFLKVKNNEIISKYEYAKRVLLRDGVDASICSKIFKASLFNNTYFLENKRFEDFEIIFKLIDKSKAISLTNDTVYFYRLHNESFHNKFYLNTIKDLLEANYNAFIFAKNNKNYELEPFEFSFIESISYSVKYFYLHERSFDNKLAIKKCIRKYISLLDKNWKNNQYLSKGTKKCVCRMKRHTFKFCLFLRKMIRK